MKTLQKLTGLAVIGLTITALFYSCKKDTVLDDQQITHGVIAKRTTPRNPHQYCETNLLELGEGMLKLAKNSTTFKNKVYTEIDNKFDGDDNVLIKTLDNWYISNGSSLRAQLVNGITSNTKISAIDTALVAFDNIENGNSYYPQIFIPNYDSLKTAGVINSSTPPVLVVYVSGDDDVTQFVGYTWNSSTQSLNTLPVYVTESYARSHEVWVLSLNEMVDNTGTLPATGNGTPTTQSCKINARIDRMQVKDRKETDFSGKSEVRYMGKLTWDNGYSPYSGLVAAISSLRTPGSGDFKGAMIRKFSKSEINNNHLEDNEVNLTIETGWNYCDLVYDAVKHIYVVFEYDPWPAGKKTSGSDIDGNGTNDATATLEYRSGGSGSKSLPYASPNADGFVYSYNVAPVSSYSIANSAILYYIEPF